MDKQKYRCKLCRRDKFDRDYVPHTCNRQFRKKLPKFEKVKVMTVINENSINNIYRKGTYGEFYVLSSSVDIHNKQKFFILPISDFLNNSETSCYATNSIPLYQNNFKAEVPLFIKEESNFVIKGSELSYVAHLSDFTDV